MKDPIQKYFQVGTIQWMTHPPVNYPILDSVKTICCDEYFNALEITHIEDQETKGQGKGYAGPEPHEGVLRRTAPPAGTKA